MRNNEFAINNHFGTDMLNMGPLASTDISCTHRSTGIPVPVLEPEPKQKCSSGSGTRRAFVFRYRNRNRNKNALQVPEPEQKCSSGSGTGRAFLFWFRFRYRNRNRNSGRSIAAPVLGMLVVGLGPLSSKFYV